MIKLYFKGESTKFLNLNEETGEPDDEDSANKPEPQATADSLGYEDLPEPPPAEDFGGQDFDKTPPPATVDDEIF